MSRQTLNTIRRNLGHCQGLLAPRCYGCIGWHGPCSLTERHYWSLAAASSSRSRVRREPRSHAQRHSSEIGGGTDLLADSLAFGDRRKVVLDSYYPTGFDVLGVLEFTRDPNVATDGEDDTEPTQSAALHMNGSIIAFPHSCFLWNVSGPKDVTVESLSMVVLQKPPVEFLFIGSNQPLPPREVNRIKDDFKKRGIVVEQLDVTNAMGTFNILNGEDRRVAVALVKDPE